MHSFPVRLAAIFLLLGLTLALPGLAQEKSGVVILGKLQGHGDGVTSLAFSPDGKLLATGSFDHAVKLWNAATGKEVQSYGEPSGHQKMVTSVAFSPDGLTVASGSVDNTLKVWDVPQDGPLRSRQLTDTSRAVAVSPDGTKLAVGGNDGSLRILNAIDFKELARCDGQRGPIHRLHFSSNGQVLASAGADGMIHCWNPANGAMLGSIGAHTGNVNAVVIAPNNANAFSSGDDGTLKQWQLPPALPKTFAGSTGNVRALVLSTDGNQLLTAGDDKIVRHYAAAGNLVRALTGAEATLNAAAFGPNNAMIAAGTADGRVLLWNAAEGKLLASWRGHAGPLGSVQFQPQTNHLLTTGHDGLLKTWALPTLPPRVITHPEAVTAALASADGKQLFTGSTDKLVRVWDVERKAIVKQFAGHTGAITALAVSANGQVIVSGGSDGTIRLWNPQTGKETAQLLGHRGTISALALHPSGTSILSSGDDGTLRLWQLPTVAPKVYMHPDQVAGAIVMADGKRLVTACRDRQVRLWNLDTGALERTYSGPTLPILSIALSGNGSTLAAAAADKTVTLWSLADGKLLSKLNVAATALLLSPDGQTVVTGLADGTLKWCNVRDGKESKNVPAHPGGVNALLLHPRGDLFYACGADKTVRVWSFPEGKALATLAHTGPVAALTLSKDGTKLAAASDHTLKVWSVPEHKELASWPIPAGTRGLGFAPDGQRLVLAHLDKLARIYRVDGSLLEELPHEGAVDAAYFVDDKRLVTAGADKQARLWTSALRWQQTQPGSIKHALFSPQGDLVFATEDKRIRVWNAADGKAAGVLTAAAAVNRLGIAADASRLVSTGADQAVQVWNLLPTKPGTPLDAKPLRIPLGATTQALAVSPAGQRVAVGVSDGPKTLIRVFDTSQGRELQTLDDHRGAMHALSFLPDQRTLVTASADKTARLLDVHVTSALPVHPAGVTLAATHGNGTQVVTAGADKTVKLWDAAKGTMVKTFGPLPDPIKALALSRDAMQVGCAAGKVVKVWSLADGKEVVTLEHPAEALSLSFSPDKTKIATGAADQRARVWDAATGKELQFMPQDDAVGAVIFAPTNITVFTAGGKLPRLETLAWQRSTVVAAGPVRDLALLPNQTHLVIVGSDKDAKLWNLGNGTLERSFTGARGPLHAVAVAKNNPIIATGGSDGIIRLYQPSDGKELGTIKAGAVVRTLAFSANGALLLGSADDKTLTAWNVAFQPNLPLPAEFLKPVQRFSTSALTHDCALGADGVAFYTVGAEQALHAWKLAGLTPIRNFAHPSHVDALAFQAEGKILASGGHDGRLRFFDLPKNALLKEINAHAAMPSANPIYSIAYAPDGKQLVSSSFDNSLKLWDATSGTLVREFKAYKAKEFEKGHQEPIHSAVFSPDGKFLASGSGGQERIIKIWNVADGIVVRDLANPHLKTSPLQPAVSHPGWVYGLRFTKDGRHLLSVGDAPGNAGYLAVWDWRGGKLLRGETLPLGVFYGLALSPDEKTLAVAAGNRGRPRPEFNVVYLLKSPIP